MRTIKGLCMVLGALVAISISGCHLIENERMPQEKIAYERSLDYKGEQFKVTLTELVWGVGNEQYDVQVWPKLPVATILVPAAHDTYFHCFQNADTRQWQTIIYRNYTTDPDGQGIMLRDRSGAWRNRGMASPLSPEQIEAMTDFCSYALMNVRSPEFITARGRPAHS